MPRSTTTRESDTCITACQTCSKTCRQMALTHCLPLGGKHVEPDHFRLMFDCIAACDAAATLMANGSPYHSGYCALCAEICRACAASCEDVGDMDACVRACQECAAACDAMALQDMPPERGQGTGRDHPGPRPS